MTVYECDYCGCGPKRHPCIDCGDACGEGYAVATCEFCDARACPDCEQSEHWSADPHLCFMCERTDR